MGEESKPEYIARRLRPEANALYWEQLNSSQQEALRRCLYVIEEAVEHLSNGSDAPLADLVELDRESRSLFLSGDRGTGKTSVLLSLIAHTLPNRSGLPKPDYQSKQQRFTPAIEKLNKRVLWLKPIDMEPLPAAFSLLASILIRIEEACERVARRRRSDRFSGPGNVDPLFSEAMQELQTLQSDIALAWESNLPERRSSLDPDTYSIEVMRTARAGMAIGSRLNRILDRIADEVFPAGPLVNPLFVVTIDDFDMHPASCLQVLRLLRMLSCPRLFFLMLGDFRLLDMMLNLQLSNELASVAENRPESMLSYRPQELAREAAAIAATSLRKMLPPDQRVRVSHLTLAEGLQISPTGKPETGTDSIHLYQLMQNLPLAVDGSLLQSRDRKDDAKAFASSLQLQVLSDLILCPGVSVIKHSKTTGDTLEVRCQKRSDPLPQPDRASQSKNGNLTFDYFEQKIVRNGDTETEKEFLRHFCDESLALCSHWPVYSGLFWLETTPRRATDSWFALRRRVDDVTRDARKIQSENREGDYGDNLTESTFGHEHCGKLLEDLIWHCREALLEDAVFTPRQRQSIRMSMTKSSEGAWNWSMLPVTFHSRREIPREIHFRWNKHLRWILNESLPSKLKGGDANLKVTLPAVGKEHEKQLIKHVTAPRKAANETSDWCGRRVKQSILLFRPLGWYAHAEHEQSDQSLAVSHDQNVVRKHELREPDVSREIARSTTGLLTLCHDLIEIGPGRDAFEGSLIPRNTTDWLAWSVTRYRGRQGEELHLPWPAPRCVSVFGMDLFRSAWKEVLRDSARLSEDSAPNLAHVERLAFAWISSGTAAVLGVAPAQCDANEGVVSDKAWGDLYSRLNFAAYTFFKRVDRPDTPSTEIIRDWLINVALLVMPEYGLPETLMMRVLFGYNPDADTVAELYDFRTDDYAATPDYVSRINGLDDSRLQFLHEKSRASVEDFSRRRHQKLRQYSWMQLPDVLEKFRKEVQENDKSVKDFKQAPDKPWFLVFLNHMRREIREARTDILARIRVSVGGDSEFDTRLRLSCSEWLTAIDFVQPEYRDRLLDDEERSRYAAEDWNTHRKKFPGCAFEGRGLVPPERSVRNAAHRYRWEWDAPAWLRERMGQWAGTLPVWVSDLIRTARTGTKTLKALKKRLASERIFSDEELKQLVVLLSKIKE